MRVGELRESIQTYRPSRDDPQDGASASTRSKALQAIIADASDGAAYEQFAKAVHRMARRASIACRRLERVEALAQSCGSSS